MDRWAPCIAAAIYLAAMLALYPFRDVFEFNPDEGIEAQKALMLQRGHALYSEMWDDQPPLFTYSLATMFRAFGSEVNHGRILVLVFAAAIVFAVYDVLRLRWGHAAAIAAVVLLPCTTFFMKLSVSVMAGLPAIALALLCVWGLLRWEMGGGVRWLVASGVVMGLSLVMKLFTGFLVPVFGLWILLVAARREAFGWRVLLPPACWSAVVLLTAGSILFSTITPSQLDQLYEGHVALRSLEIARARDDADLLSTMIAADREVALLAALGTALLVVRRQWPLLIVPAWCVAAYAVLRLHAPIFYHYQLLLTVPGCMLAGIAVSEVFSRGWAVQRALPGLAVRLTAIVVIGLLAAMLTAGENREVKHVIDWGDRDRFVVALMQTYASKTRVVVVDRLMYAFRSGFAVPANLAVVSRKRIETANLTTDEILETIEREQPEQVAMSWNFPHDTSVRIMAAIQEHYRLAYFDMEGMRLRLYVRTDVGGDPLAALQRAAGQVPTVARGHDAVGIEWARRGEPDQAIASFRRALEVDPTHVLACRHLADAYMSRDDYLRGFAVLQACSGTRDRDRFVAIARTHAWRRATCPNPAYRNGREAGMLARRVMTVLNRPSATELETLGAALAAQGKFDLAVDAVQRALPLVDGAKANARAAELEREIDAYRHSQPWIETVALPVY